MSHVTYRDPDGTLKKVFEVESKYLEIVQIIKESHPDRDVYCVPSHFNCNLGCKFCHLTDEVKRPMPQVRFTDILNNVELFERDGSKCLFSFMGTGEPLLNLELLKDMYAFENHFKGVTGYEKVGYALASMVPSLDNLKQLVSFLNYSHMCLKFYFSLHSPLKDVRDNLIPSSKIDICEALNILSDYNANKEELRDFHKNDDAVVFHYTLIKGVNDCERSLEAMDNLAAKYKIPVKLISFNEKEDLTQSDRSTLISWKEVLSANTRVSVYTPPGRDIGTSCGAFKRYYYMRDKFTSTEQENFKEYMKQYLVIPHEGLQYAN